MAMRNFNISSIIIVNITILLLSLSKINLASSDALDVASKEPELTHDRQNGLNIFIGTVNSLTKYELKALIKSQEYIFSTYLEPEDQVVSLSNDIDEYQNKILKKNITDFERVLFHIPIETKGLMAFNTCSRTEHAAEIAVQNYFFPRLKHFKKDLPELTFEPYQRVMGFAIEVCMLPTVWYLELVHCMYVATSGYFDGMLMSYSLQDLVGSAIISMDYRNEQFSMENCIKYLPLFSDNKISSHFKEICETAKSCLESRSFYTDGFSNFKSEFSNRIQEVYRVVPPLNNALDPITFARYSILYSLSILLKESALNKNLPERNFLPIRVMAASIGYYALSEKMNMRFSSERRLVAFFTKLISNMLFEKTEIIIRRCSEELTKFSDLVDSDLFEFFTGFCREIFSIGFIDESYRNLVKVDPRFIASIHPKRILLQSYSSIVPEMFHELPFSGYSTSWIDFKNTSKDPSKYSRGRSSNHSVEILDAQIDKSSNSTLGQIFDSGSKFVSLETKSLIKNKKLCISISKKNCKKKSTKKKNKQL